MGGERLRVDQDGTVWVGDFRLPFRVDPAGGALEFFDKDRRRSARRGSQIVRVTISAVLDVLQPLANKGANVEHGE